MSIQMRVHEGKRVVTAEDTLHAKMAPGGGYIAYSSPIKQGESTF